MNKPLNNDDESLDTVFAGSMPLSDSRWGTVRSDLEPDEMLLSLLTVAVKALTRKQVAEFLAAGSSSPDSTAKRLVRKLRSGGWIEVTSKTIGLFPTDSKPLLIATSGEATSTDFASVAWQLQKREQQTKPVKVQIIKPTKKACKRFGGRVAAIKANQLAHDLHVSHVALSNLHRGQWIREDYLGLHGFGEGLLPDGFIIRPKNLPNIVVEIGSATYHKTRLQALTEAFASSSQARFEIW